MSQKLSAMKYIKNNKRRVSVLIVSLGLCFALIYLTQFLLSSTEETIRPILLDNARKIQYINLAGSSLGIDVEHLSGEEINAEYEQKIHALAERLEAHPGVKAVYYAPVAYVNLVLVVGDMGGGDTAFAAGRHSGGAGVFRRGGHRRKTARKSRRACA